MTINKRHKLHCIPTEQLIGTYHPVSCITTNTKPMNHETSRWLDRLQIYWTVYTDQ